MVKNFFEQFPTIMGLDCTKEVLGNVSNDKHTLDYRITFVLKNYPIAIEAGKKYGIHPLMLLAQASVESSWGTTELSRTFNNFYALTDASEEKENEYWSGKIFVTEKGHRMKIYKSERDSFFDFARLLKKQHPNAQRVSDCITQYADSIACHPYLPFKGKDKMCIAKYRTLIIRSAVSILAIAKITLATRHN